MFNCFSRRRLLAFALLAILLPACAGSFGAKPATPVQHDAEAALGQALAELDAKPGDAGLLLITNAGYGQAQGHGSEAYLDIAMRATGCTPGTQSLLAIVTPAREPLWFALCRPEARKVVFLKLQDHGFARQVVDITPERILTPDGWAEAAKGPLGKRTFSVVSIALSRAAGASWPMLKAAQLHDHFCPGLNAGFIVLEHLQRKLPLGQGDQYVFVGAPPFCAMDAFQILEGRTVGKKGALGLMDVPGAGSSFAENGVQPDLIVLRVNKKQDVCDGVVLGLDWSDVYAAAGVSEAEFSPPGGPSNPLFFVSRARMSYTLAQLPMQDKLGYLQQLHRFSGPASLARRVTQGGADPYRTLPD
jgi:formylmethanofuran dehydrogenase subunit E-like metal-binding protein